jgi:tetratricopeptide (TPR) repeat protein/HEAT repeat protein
MVRARGSFFLSYPELVRIAALGGTAFLVVAMLAAPARADWAVKRQSREPLIDQIARELQTHPTERPLATRLAHAAPKATLDRLLEAFAARASRGDDPGPVLAYAQLLLAAGRAAEAAAAFERAAGAANPAFQLAAYEGWALALRTTGDRAQAVAIYQRALGIEKRPAERRRLLHLLVASAGDPQQLDSEVAARRELCALEPGNDGTALALVDALERAGQPRPAAQVLEDRLAKRRAETGPTLIALRLRVAALYESAGALDRAAEILAETERGLSAGDVRRRREVWLRIMEIARRRGTLAELAKQLEAPALARGPAEWESLSEVRDELGDLNGALEAARHAQSRQPRDVEIGRRVAALLDRLGREDEVTAELAALAHLAPSDPRFTIDLIERQFRTATKEEARAELDRAIARFGNNPSALGQLADLAGRWSENRRALDAWQRLLRLSPHDEMAILGLGEVQFQAHKKDAAIHTWQALRSGRSSKADGSARLAEVLMEHDLLDEATAEVEQAEALEPKEPRHRRLMAQILERQRRPDAAIAEWERVMAMNVGATHAAERREARSRILGILGREGRARLEDKILKLRAEVDAHPERRETALFLAEAELRSDAVASAIETLRATLARDRAHAAGSADASDDAQAEVILTLVRLLRQTRQLDEAVRLLAELAQRIPTRAREAHIQIADIELGRYEDQQALDHASSAARLAPDDGRALIRIAEVQERAGEIDAALANYRRAFGRDANPSAAFALARLLTRRGSTAEASEILRGVLRAASDEETITETGRRAIDLEEYLGTLDDLERVVSGLLFSNPNGAAYRRLLAEIYRRLLPSLYRAPAVETAAAENRARIAQHGLRPLLELVTEADGDPERGLIELLGMLGNRDAAPALARLAQGSVGSSGEALLRTSSGSGNETQLTAIIALGRLGDARARPALETLVAAPDTTVRAAAIWALGRMATPETGELLAAQTSSHLDVAGFAYLGLGRTGDHRWGADLARATQDPSQPPKLRRAAAVALGLSRNRAGVPALMSLLDSASDELAGAGAAALGVLGDTSLLPSLFGRALLDPNAITGAETPALAAIDRLIGNAPIEDEAKAIDGTRLDLEAMLDVLTAPPPRVARGDRALAWIPRSREIEEMLRRALNGDRGQRVLALQALDARADGPGLGVLAPDGNAPLAPGTAAALQRLGGALRAQVFALLDDGSPEVRALALRVAAKIGGDRTGEPLALTPARIVAAAGTTPVLLPEAAAFALAAVAARHPEMRAAILPAVAPLLGDSTSWERRLAAVEMLAPAGPAARVLLEEAAKDPSPFVRSAAVTVGAASGSTAILLAGAADPIPAVRAAAARALARRQAVATTSGTEALPASLAPLMARLSHDPSDLVRSALAHLEP